MSSTMTLMHPATRVRGGVALLPDAPCAGGTRVPASVRNALVAAPAHDSWAIRTVCELSPAYDTRFAAQGPLPRGLLV